MSIIDFESMAIAKLQQRVAVLGEVNSDLLAFAQGHSGAVEQIHSATIAALDATGLEQLIHVVTRDWVEILRVDAVCLGLATDNQGIRASAQGLQFIDPEQVELWSNLLPVGQVRTVKQGSPVFGEEAVNIRSEALIAVKPVSPLPSGILALGCKEPHAFNEHHGTELLAFLGAVVSRMMTRWMLNQP